MHIVEEQLRSTINDLFAAGILSTSSSIRWALLFLLHNPDIQTKLQKEIDHVVGEGRFPFLDDRKSLHYMEAFLAEVLRRGNMFGNLSTQLSNNDDTTIKDIFIKSGTIVIPNFDSVFMDPEIFPEPERFDPCRFLDSDGKFASNEKLIAFGIGWFIW